MVKITIKRLTYYQSFYCLLQNDIDRLSSERYHKANEHRKGIENMVAFLESIPQQVYIIGIATLAIAISLCVGSIINKRQLKEIYNNTLRVIAYLDLYKQAISKDEYLTFLSENDRNLMEDIYNRNAVWQKYAFEDDNVIEKLKVETERLFNSGSTLYEKPVGDYLTDEHLDLIAKRSNKPMQYAIGASLLIIVIVAVYIVITTG